MARFYGYIDKVFEFRRLTALLTDSRPEPVIATTAIFGTAFAMFATGRGSLNGIDKERHFPGRLRNFVGARVPSGDSVGPCYFDAVVGDGLYFEAPFLNFCREHHKHVIVVVKGDHRLLLQDAQGLFSPLRRRRPMDRGPANHPILGRRGLYLCRRRHAALAGVAHPGD